ncbi:MAG: polysaccharide biosynthesis/export family protein [Proteobacteria bacterium]|nr:polysaccharide biosynthesis/export family protein [Pseudomonadota bacterium]
MSPVVATAQTTTPSSPSAPVDSAAKVARASPYLINAGDELEIYVWGEERLQRVVRVLPDGTIAFPLVGQLVAQGKQLSDLEAMISERLTSQYRGQVPQVTVSVKDPSGMQFSVMGRVKSPGSFSPGRYINVLEALSMAGGPADFANLDNILVIRKSGNAVQTFRLRLAGIFRSGGSGTADSTNIVKIETGDTVIVP